MAETTIVKSANASVDTSTGMVAPQISGKLAGEDIASACTPLQLKSDGRLWKASGAAADSNARIVGIATRAAKAGQPVTVYGLGVVFKYADETLTPGSLVFLGTGGTLSSTASVGDTVGIAQAIDASNMRLTRAI